MKKILITGATGFIGKNFLKLKNLQKNKLYCLVRKKIKSKKKITWYETAIEDSRNLKKIKKKITEIDTLYHFAWGNLPNYQSKIHTTEELKKQKFFLKNFCFINSIVPTLTDDLTINKEFLCKFFLI